MHLFLKNFKKVREGANSLKCRISRKVWVFLTNGLSLDRCAASQDRATQKRVGSNQTERNRSGTERVSRP